MYWFVILFLYLCNRIGCSFPFRYRAKKKRYAYRLRMNFRQNFDVNETVIEALAFGVDDCCIFTGLFPELSFTSDDIAVPRFVV